MYEAIVGIDPGLKGGLSILLLTDNGSLVPDSARSIPYGLDKYLCELKNAIEIMFCDCDEIVEAVFSEYHCNYVPVDEKYERIDVSWRHPNTFNK